MTTIDTYVLDTKGRQVIVKDPAAVLDYTFDWTAYLLPITDTIASVEFALFGSTDAAIDNTSSTTVKATIWVSGGIVGELLQLDCAITTSSTPPRTDSRSVYIRIKDR